MRNAPWCAIDTRGQRSQQFLRVRQESALVGEDRGTDLHSDPRCRNRWIRRQLRQEVTIHDDVSCGVDAYDQRGGADVNNDGGTGNCCADNAAADDIAASDRATRHNAGPDTDDPPCATHDQWRAGQSR